MVCAPRRVDKACCCCQSIFAIPVKLKIMHLWRFGPIITCRRKDRGAHRDTLGVLRRSELGLARAVVGAWIGAVLLFPLPAVSHKISRVQARPVQSSVAAAGPREPQKRGARLDPVHRRLFTVALNAYQPLHPMSTKSGRNQTTNDCVFAFKPYRNS